MGMKSRLKKEKKRATKVLREVIGTDLLTWKDALIQGQVSGLYSLTNEQAYFRCPGDPSSLSLAELERKLKEIDPAFIIVPCEFDTKKECIQGHSIYFEVPAFGGFIKVCNVGKNRDYNIPANSVGKIVQYEGDSFQYSGRLDEEPLLYRGWVAAYECCKTAYAKWESEGISPAMVLNPKEVLNMRKAFSMIGARAQLEIAKSVHENMIESDNKIIAAMNATADSVIGEKTSPTLADLEVAPLASEPNEIQTKITEEV